MINLRRIYVYLVSAITLQAVVWSIIALLRNMTGSGLRTAPTSTIAAQVAMILVGLPLYLAHWLWAQRIAARDVKERSSPVRRFYLDGMLLAFIYPLLSSITMLLQSVLDDILGAYGHVLLSRPSAWYYVISLLVNAIMALYHYWIRRQDDKHEVVQDDAIIVLDQFLIYILTLTGLFFTAIGVAQLLRLAASIPGAAFNTLDIEENISNYLSLVIVGLPLWIISWRQAQLRFSSGDKREQLSFVRKAALYLIVFISSLTAVTTAAILVANLLLELLGVPSSSGGLFNALSVIIVTVVIWAYHARVLQQDAVVAEAVGLGEVVRRIYLYLVSGVGLSAVLVGTGGILSVLIRAIDGASLGPDLREQLAWFTAALIAGLPVWLISWRRIQHSVAEPGAAGIAERGAFTRRLYLTVFAFVAIMTLLGGAVYVVAQIVELILGSRTTAGLFTDIGQALGYTLIAGAVLVYHGLLLRSDQRVLAEQEIEGRRQLHVAIVDSGNGRLGRFLIDHLQDQLPGLNIGRVPLTKSARETMIVESQQQSGAEILRGADIIVTPWQLADEPAEELISDDEVSDAYYQSQAHKLMLPRPQRGVTWIGVEPWQEKAIANEVEDVINQIAKGESPAAARKLSTPVIVLIVLASLFGLLILIPLVIQLLSLLIGF